MVIQTYKNEMTGAYDYEVEDSLKSFIIWTLLLGSLIGIWWYKLCPNYIYNSFTNQYIVRWKSIVLFIGILIASAVICGLFLATKKNLWTEFLAAIVPIQMIAILWYGVDYWMLFFIPVILILFLNGKDFVDIKQKQTHRRNIGKNARINPFSVGTRMLKRSLRVTQCTLMVAFVFLFFVRILVPTLHSPRFHSSKMQEFSYESDQAIFLEHAQMFKKLTEEAFFALPQNEQENVLGEFANVDLASLGGHPVQLRIQELNDDTLAGYYNNRDKEIVINQKILDVGYAMEDVLQVVLHEVHHAYAHTCVEQIDLSKANTNLKLYRDVLEWKENIDNYQDMQGGDDIEAYIKYASQALEQHAEAYSRDRVNTYMSYIYTTRRMEEN